MTTYLFETEGSSHLAMLFITIQKQNKNLNKWINKRWNEYQKSQWKRCNKQSISDTGKQI